MRPNSDSPQTIAEAVVAKYGVTPQQVQWHADIESKLWGTIRITADIPQVDDSLTWVVDVSAQRVMPESAAAENLFAN